MHSPVFFTRLLCSGKRKAKSKHNSVSNHIVIHHYRISGIVVRSYSTTLQRDFTVNGAITRSKRSAYFYVDPAKQNEETLLPSIRNGSYIMFYGPRACGKSTRVDRAAEQLQDEFCCLNVSFQSGVDFDSKGVFWSSFGKSLCLNNSHVPLPTLTSAIDFLQMIANHNLFGGKRVVLFIDEFDELYKAPQDVLDSLLNVLRSIKQDQTKPVLITSFYRLFGYRSVSTTISSN